MMLKKMGHTYRLIPELGQIAKVRSQQWVSTGMPGDKGARFETRNTRARRAETSLALQPSFDFGDDPANGREYTFAGEPIAHHHFGPSHPINDRLTASILSIIAATDVADWPWNTAIVELIAGGKVALKDEKHGSRNQVIETGGK